MATSEIWSRYFPDFSTCQDTSVDRLMKMARVLEIASHQTVFHPGGACGNYLLVVEGVVQVKIITPSGREVLLYRVSPGHACILTTSCLLGANDYPAFGYTETAVTALAVPAEYFHQAMGQSVFFRSFVFTGFAERLSSVIGRMEELVDGDIDRMLAQTLIDSADDGQVRMTHQELAVAIGSAREVVSRHLKRFEQSGWVRLGRGILDVTNEARLRRMAKFP